MKKLVSMILLLTAFSLYAEPYVIDTYSGIHDGGGSATDVGSNNTGGGGSATDIGEIFPEPSPVPQVPEKK